MHPMQFSDGDRPDLGDSVANLLQSVEKLMCVDCDEYLRHLF